RLGHLVHALGGGFAAILQVELEAARGAEAEDRRRDEGEHQRLLDTARLGEHLADELRCRDLAIVPGYLRHEDGSRIVAKAATQKVETGERYDVRIGGIGANHL